MSWRCISRSSEAEELRHVAFRRRDHRGVPAHHMIAGEHGALADQRKAEMVRRVARHVQHVEREALGPDRVAVGKRAVRHEGGIDEIVAETRRAGAARRAGRPERGDLAAEQRLQGARARRNGRDGCA